MAYAIATKGLSGYRDLLAAMPQQTRQAARLAINTSAKRGRADGSRRIRGQVRFTAGYLNQPGRFHVSRLATDIDATAVISARTEPTSLARFATQATRGGKRAGLRIGVKQGGGRPVLRSAFFINLRSGNRGVAVRSAVLNKLNLRRVGVVGKASKNGYVLLYGPSVDQVFRTVREDMVPGLSAFTNAEFLRQFSRLSKSRAR